MEIILILSLSLLAFLIALKIVTKNETAISVEIKNVLGSFKITKEK